MNMNTKMVTMEAELAERIKTLKELRIPEAQILKVLGRCKFPVPAYPVPEMPASSSGDNVLRVLMKYELPVGKNETLELCLGLFGGR